MPLPPSASPSLPCAGGGAAAFGRYPYWRSLLPTAALAGDSRDRGAAPCGLVAGSRHLRTGLGRLPLAIAPWAAGPCGLAAGDSPLLAGHSRSCPRGFCHCGWQPLAGGLAAAGHPCKGVGRGHARLPLARASFAAKM
ncbi:hypothetical protein GW17_00054677 [Ensete ventricosum]|nr:hypothetical protein GW17_00054677 [Ensete ventricosum]